MLADSPCQFVGLALAYKGNKPLPKGAARLHCNLLYSLMEPLQATLLMQLNGVLISLSALDVMVNDSVVQ